MDAKIAKQVGEIENLRDMVQDLENQVAALKSENKELQEKQVQEVVPVQEVVKVPEPEPVVEKLPEPVQEPEPVVEEVRDDDSVLENEKRIAELQKQLEALENSKLLNDEGHSSSVNVIEAETEQHQPMSNVSAISD